ncbi:MAG: hypothetical protein JNJ54_21020 [Myxococcaceae bacterium]|nr:hypothetical protein [Myxococcaceae bacterium]
MVTRLAHRVAPYVFGVVFSVGVAWLVRSLSVMGGACRVLCYPPFTIGMGVVAGVLGAWLYRSNYPVREPGDDEPVAVPLTGPSRVSTGRPRLRRRF